MRGLIAEGIDYATVLVPLSSGGLSAQEKKLMINKFVEVR